MSGEFALSAVGQAEDTVGDMSGAVDYDYYCYQCHGYSGDANTLAATYLHPEPRNFTRSDANVLTREAMVEAVTHGRPETAMVGFASVLSSARIEAVVDFIRAAFMAGRGLTRRYHTEANGWLEHERYAPAYPFATGEVPLDVPWEALTAEQRGGKRLYMSACITCHDRATVNNDGPIWESRSLSYPRGGYSHKDPPVDAYTGASPSAIHDQPPKVPASTLKERRGQRLYQENCAFCHAADGTGRNWIGSFMQPHPRDLTGSAVDALSDAALTLAIRDGLPGTSMPAWGQVFTETQVADIIAYIRHAFGGRDNDHRGPSLPGAARPKQSLRWRRAPAR